MNKYNLKDLLKKYPELFGTDFDPMKTLIGFGFEVGSAWRDVIVSYLPEISKIVKEDNLTDFRIIQIKEKFGRLSIYTRNTNGKIDELIKEIALECSKTCDKCGTKENVSFHTDGWYRVRCDDCENN